ncbi:MAG: HD domain-containing protein [candidate division Zixibacteria bacterium]|nr:HD domain-containing protein [candidate division Zixibacteria bacterium]
MEDRIKELLPELADIEEGALRDKVVAVYKAALERGGWQPEDMARLPSTLLIDPPPATYVEHTRAVTRCAVAAAEAMAAVYGSRVNINRDHLVAAGLLHDVGKLLEYREEGGKFVKSELGRMLRHPLSGAALCYGFGLPPEVTHVVATHAREGEGARATPEAIIIHHADFINFEPFKL